MSEAELGQQPIKQIIEELGLSNSDIVAASTENITFKMLAKACKGRRLTPQIQRKICSALNAASSKSYSVKDLFTY